MLAEGGNAPDVGFVPQPGLMNRLAAGGWLIPGSEGVEANVDEFWSEDWKQYGTFEDTFYGAPLMASIKGYVWYSPTEFEEKGYEIPTDPRRAEDARPTRSRPRATTSRGAWASSPVRPRAGRAPTGSRTTCCA